MMSFACQAMSKQRESESKRLSFHIILWSNVGLQQIMVSFVSLNNALRYIVHGPPQSGLSATNINDNALDGTRGGRERVVT